MVLTQPTGPASRLIFKILRFHTTMVLTQLCLTLPIYGRCLTFPYHYGSHATEIRYYTLLI